MSVLYRTKATSHGGRQGHVKSHEGTFELDLALPKEMGGPGGKANPEQLFAAGYAACFENAVLHVARAAKAPIRDTAVTAEVGIGPRAEGGFQLSVALEVTVGGVDQATAEAIVAKAHEVCPYSNATRNNIEVTLSTRAV
jgi:Ohr subfamily peroxiredoxin